MESPWHVFFMGVFFGVIVCVLSTTIPASTLSVVRNAINECEKSLPRDQHCKIIAVPKEKDER